MHAHAERSLKRLTEEGRDLVPEVVEVRLRYSTQAWLAQNAAADELVEQPHERLALVGLQARVGEVRGEVGAFRRWGVRYGGEERENAIVEEDGERAGGDAVGTEVELGRVLDLVKLDKIRCTDLVSFRVRQISP